MSQESAQDNAAKPPARTGLAMVTAIVVFFILSFVLYVLFGFIVSRFAIVNDNLALELGISALNAVAMNVFSCIPAAALAKRLFPRANFTRVFSAFVALYIVSGVALALHESVERSGSVIVVMVYIFAAAVTIFGLWVYLRPGVPAGSGNQ
jgi:hypothetical protein